MVGLVAAAAVSGAFGAVVVNPGFEDGLTGWQFTRPASAAWSTGVVHSGAGALQFTVPVTTGTTIAYQTFPMVNGPVNVSFWLFLDTALPANAFFDVAAGRSFLTVPTIAPGVWTKIDFSPFAALFTRSTEFRLYLNAPSSNAAGVKVYLDDVGFEPVPAPGVLGVGAVCGLGLVRRRSTG